MRWLFNLGINIVAMIIFAILYFVTVFSGIKRKKVEIMLGFLLVLAFSAVTFAMIYYAFLLEEYTNYTVYYLFIGLRYTASYMTTFLFLMYYINYLELKRKTKFVIGFIFGALAIASVVAIVTNPAHFTFYTLNLSIPFRGFHFSQTNLYPFVHSFSFLVFVFCIGLSLFRKNLTKMERFSLTLFPSLLLSTLIMHIVFEEYSIYSIGLIAGFLTHYLFYYIQRGRIINEQQQELSEQQMRIMISQIQPHFIYNCLSAISYLCVEDGEKAAKAIEDFSNYLRGNFSNIDRTRIVPFSKELEHTQAYLRLEKMRFENRVNVEYDIKCSDFVIPSLTLQPIVENAVKHGICKKAKGGTVKIHTYEDNKNYYIKVEDDGIGFDMNEAMNEDERIHVGLRNVENRIEHLAFGKIEINSTPNVGTVVVLTLPKEKIKKLRGGG